MKIRYILAAFCGISAISATVCSAGDWVTAPSYYSHDLQTGQRVQQFAPIGPFYTQAQGNYQRSGFHQTRSTIQVGASMDNYHVVETFGAPVRPYGEWRFPFRPGSVPAYLSTPPWGGFGFGGFRGPLGIGGPGLPGIDRGSAFPGTSIPPPAGPGTGYGRPGAGLFDLYPEREGHHIPFNTPDPYQREKLLPSDSPRLPRSPVAAP